MAKILEKSFSQADYARQSFVARPAAGTPISDVMSNDYWSHVARKINPHDIIEVVPEDGAYYAKLLVLGRGNLWVKVYQLEYVEIEANTEKVGESDIKKFDVAFAGPHDKWRVVRKTDKLVVEKNFQSREDAEKWLGEHIKELAA